MRQVSRTSKEVGEAVKDYWNGRDEMNLVEFPLALLSERSAANVTTLEYRDEIEDKGIPIQRHVVVAATAHHGLPTAKDEDVLMGMLQLAKLQNDFTSPKVYFTRLQLIRILGWDNCRWSYDRIVQSLDRWRSVSITYKKAWRDNSNREWQDRGGFGLIDSYSLKDSRKVGQEEKDNAPEETLSWFRWNGFLFDSFQAGYLKKLDYGVYRELKQQAAKRLYRYLDKHFYEPHRLRIELDLNTLAFEHLGMSRNYDSAQVRRSLLRAIAELEEIGFIEFMSDKTRFVRLSRGRWSVVFQKKVDKKGMHSGRKVPNHRQRVLPERKADESPSSPSRPRPSPKAAAAEEFLRSKTPEEREKITAEALKRANPFLRSNYEEKKHEGGLLFEECRRLITHQYVITLLAEKASASNA